MNPVPLPKSSLESSLQFGTKISNFLSFFESYLSDIVVSFDEPVRDLAKHVVLSGGKRIRPMLVYICGLNNRFSTEHLLKASTVIELVHIATLVHDDILDSASLRRGKPTLHIPYGQHNSILLGDALFSFALELATDFPDSTVCKIVSTATRKTCSGEINQTFSREDFTLSLQKYYEIIQDKTGELFNASCSVGGFLGGEDSSLIDLLGDFGTSLGLNYQIYDDLIDTFGKNSSFGKTLGTDFETGKITLPIIMLLNSLSDELKQSLVSSLKTKKSSTEFRFYLNDLFLNYGIHELCFNELKSRLSNSKLIASNIPDKKISSGLISFLETFDSKLQTIASNTRPNFLAQIQ